MIKFAAIDIMMIIAIFLAQATFFITLISKKSKYSIQSMIERILNIKEKKPEKEAEILSFERKQFRKKQIYVSVVWAYFMLLSVTGVLYFIFKLRS